MITNIGIFYKIYRSIFLFTFLHTVQSIEHSIKIYHSIYLIVGGIDSILLPIKSVLFIDNVVVVLYEPEWLSWYSGSAATMVGCISVFDKSFFFSEFVLTFD